MLRLAAAKYPKGQSGVAVGRVDMHRAEDMQMLAAAHQNQAG